VVDEKYTSLECVFLGSRTGLVLLDDNHKEDSEICPAQCNVSLCVRLHLCET
jgi:hypothetical protein